MTSYFLSCHERVILHNCNVYIYIFYAEMNYILQLSQCPPVVKTFETYISHTCDGMVLQQI